MAFVVAVLASQALVYLAGPPSDVARPLWIWAGLAGLAALLPRTRGLARKLALSLVVTSLFLCLADLALRRWLPAELYTRPGSGVTHRLPDFPLVSRYNPGSLRLPRRGDLAIMTGTTIEDSPGYVQDLFFDSLGFPNKDEERDRPLELILLGDSFGVGGVCTYEDTWARQLEQVTGKPTYSLSIPGSPWHQLMNLKLTLRELPLAADATVVWSFFVGNDLGEYYGTALDPPPRQGAWNRWRIWLESLRARSSIRQLLDRVAQAELDAGARADNQAKARATQRRVEARRAAEAGASAPPPTEAPTHQLAWIRPGDDLTLPVVTRETPDGRPLLFYTQNVRGLEETPATVRAHPNWSRLAAVIQEMARFTEQQGLRLVATIAPTKAHAYRWILEGRAPREREAPSALAEAIGEELERAGVPYRDLTPVFQAEAVRRLRSDGSLLWWRDDTHWNPAGYRLATAQVEGLLSSLGG